MPARAQFCKTPGVDFFPLRKTPRVLGVGLESIVYAANRPLASTLAPAFFMLFRGILGLQELGLFLDKAAREFTPWDSSEFLRAYREQIWLRSEQIVSTLATKTVAKYSWIDREDLIQNMLLKTDYFATVYDPARNPVFTKHLYWKFAFYVKDVLRREDPVGIRAPQRQHYPTWFRLGDRANQASEESSCGQYIDSSVLEAEQDESSDFIESEEFRIELTKLDSMVRDNLELNKLPSMVDTGQGVCRQPGYSKQPNWDRRRNRVKLRGKDSLLRWARLNKLTTARSSKSSNQIVLLISQTKETKPMMKPQNAIERVRTALARAGAQGLTTKEICTNATLATPTANAAILSMRSSGEVYQITPSYPVSDKRYALAALYPDGPPIEQPVVAKPKPKAKPQKPKLDPVTSVSAQSVAHSSKVDQADIMVIATALAGVRNQALKNKLLTVLQEAVTA